MQGSECAGNSAAREAARFVSFGCRRTGPPTASQSDAGQQLARANRLSRGNDRPALPRSEHLAHAQKRHRLAAAGIHDRLDRLVAASTIQRFAGLGSHQLDALEALFACRLWTTLRGLRHWRRFISRTTSPPFARS